jgi:hypothetical protein
MKKRIADDFASAAQICSAHTEKLMVEQAFLPASNRRVEDIPVLREPIRGGKDGRQECLPHRFLAQAPGDPTIALRHSDFNATNTFSSAHT